MNIQLTLQDVLALTEANLNKDIDNILQLELKAAQLEGRDTADIVVRMYERFEELKRWRSDVLAEAASVALTFASEMHVELQAAKEATDEA